MKKYKVTLKEENYHTYEVEASSEDEADAKATEMFVNGNNGKEDFELNIENIEEIK